LNREATGDIHIWGFGSTEYSYMSVYTSEDYYNWNLVYSDSFGYCGSPTDIYCGHASSQFRYIAIGVYMQGYPADLFIDAVHVNA
jgi:hypothetical protein